ncbi:hypothetical protein BJX64DRAFT_295567 [Aspergillus heterothallicus]
MDVEEIQEIREQEAELIDQLNEVMVKYIQMYEELEPNLHVFITQYWKRRMDEVLTQAPADWAILRIIISTIAVAIYTTVLNNRLNNRLNVTILSNVLPLADAASIPGSSFDALLSGTARITPLDERYVPGLTSDALSDTRQGYREQFVPGRIHNRADERTLEEEDL